jgi:hypothetical protein
MGNRDKCAGDTVVSDMLSKPIPLAMMALFLGAAWLAAARGVAGAADVRLYALDCGHATFKDMALFSDT